MHNAILKRRLLFMKQNESNMILNAQPDKYSREEIERLRSFIETVKNDETRSALACWGNHNDFTKGY